MENRTKKSVNEYLWEQSEKGLLLPRDIILEGVDNNKKKRSLFDYVKWGIDHIGVLVLFHRL